MKKQNKSKTENYVSDSFYLELTQFNQKKKYGTEINIQKSWNNSVLFPS